ncbi:MAG TPA: 50S ribosomal protein L22 [Patescibacteria group bacterium]|nr:50S ribosomal protein L22 [Patescibacteria group bacterium]
MTKIAKAKPSGKRLENEAIAKARYIKGGERKLNLLAQLIRGKSAAKALIDLEFSQRRVAREVKKVLEAAIANAENNHNLDVDRLFVSEAIVGKTMVMGRLHTRGRGRSAPIEKPFCNITIRVQERAAEEKKAKKAAKGAKKEGKKPAAAKADDNKQAAE